MADLRQVLLARMTTRQRFEIPAKVLLEDLEAALYAAYQAQVAFRGGEFRESAEIDNAINSIATQLKSPDRKCGILLTGLCGNGKTTMVNAVKSVFSWMKACNDLDFDIDLNVIDAKRIAARAKDEDAFYKICNLKCLAVDDLGREPSEVLEFGNVLNPICNLIEYRYDRQLFTIISTNLTPDELQNRYGERVYDRMREMFGNVIVFKSKSFRR